MASKQPSSSLQLGGTQHDSENPEVEDAPLILNQEVPIRSTEEIDVNNNSQDQKPEEGDKDEQQQPAQRTRRRKKDIPKTYSQSVLSLLTPVSICMLIVVWAVKTLSPLLESSPVGSVTMLYNEKSDDSFWLKIGGAALNAVLIVIAFVVVTVILVILYKYRCMKLIFGWLIASSGFLLFAMGTVWLELICQAYSIPIDYFTYFFLLFNFATVGILSIFWRAHKTVTQIYLVAVSCMTAWWLTRLPEWTSWAILAAVALYDIVAVLMPRGPLKVLVETAQQRNEPIPGLIYEGKTFKLGLGDFVFYSVLVGRASMYDTTTLAACFICILTGLCMTLFILGIFKKALPALPISIGLGILFYVLTRFIIYPFVVDFGIAQIYVS